MTREIGIALENTILQKKTQEQLEKIKKHNLELEKEIEKRGQLERWVSASE